METKHVLNELILITQHNITLATSFKKLNTEALNWRQFEKSWSILECIEHLNRYGDFYITELSNCIDHSKYRKPKTMYKSGLLGGYFARIIKDDSAKKMKTFRSYDPIGSKLDVKVLDIFIAQQEAMLVCLDKARQVDLMKNKTGISISKLIRLQLGDTFRFVIYHNERHLKQAKCILSHYQNSPLSLLRTKEYDYPEIK